MNALPGFDSWLQSPVADDDSAAYERARDREIAEIVDDRERLMDAVYEEDFDAAVWLAQLRITLAKAAPAIDLLSHGDSLDDVMRNYANAGALRELFRAVLNAELLVAERVKAAAEETLS